MMKYYTLGEHLAMLSEPRKRIALRIAAEFCNYPKLAVFIPQSDTHPHKLLIEAMIAIAIQYDVMFSFMFTNLLTHKST